MGELHLSSYNRSFRQAVMWERVIAWLTLKFVAIAGLANRPKNGSVQESGRPRGFVGMRRVRLPA